jgi:hypothetical protein
VSPCSGAQLWGLEAATCHMCGPPLHGGPAGGSLAADSARPLPAVTSWSPTSTGAAGHPCCVRPGCAAAPPAPLFAHSLNADRHSHMKQYTAGVAEQMRRRARNTSRNSSRPAWEVGPHPRSLPLHLPLPLPRRWNPAPACWATCQMALQWRCEVGPCPLRRQGGRHEASCPNDSQPVPVMCFHQSRHCLPLPACRPSLACSLAGSAPTSVTCTHRTPSLLGAALLLLTGLAQAAQHTRRPLGCLSLQPWGLRRGDLQVWQQALPGD